ncbi:uncharacterized transposon-derived [Paramuricea clavata]|uniref:Uncharacterized transposon-derived n=1 Tax=Paramuricea clavata TaxID=317549 RepID=A0A6S7IAQ1_PARCT|nr:uncharacterized transposon-derived [Paramuricea clavata]
MVKRRKRSKIDIELIKKASRLLKDEQLPKEQQAAYSLHAKKISKIRCLKIFVEKRNQQWSIDLADLNELSGHNNQYRYILVCVDVYTRYAFIKLLKNKTVNVCNKFEQILTELGESPTHIQAEEGTEFAQI